MSTLARRLMAANSAAVLLDVIGTPVAYSNNTAVLTHDVPLVSGSQAGDLALLELMVHGTMVITEPPSSVVMIASAAAAGTYDQFRLFGKILSSTDITNGYLRTTLASNSRASGIMRRVTGNRPGLVLNTDFAVSAEVANSSSATIDPASLTPAWGAARNLWIAIGTGHDGAATFQSYASGYTLAQQNVTTGSGTGNQVASSCKLANLSSDDPGVITWDIARSRLGYTVAIRPQ